VEKLGRVGWVGNIFFAYWADVLTLIVLVEKM